MKDIFAIIKDRYDQVIDIMPKNADGSYKLFPEQAKLRYSLPLEDGKGQYIFDLKEQLGDKLVCPCLNRNDVMVPNSIGLYIRLYNATTKVSKLFPYAPYAPASGASVHAAGFTNEQIEALYSGRLSLMQDTTTVMGQYPMEAFKTVPNVQGKIALSSEDAAINEQVQSEGNIFDFQQLLMARYYLCGTRDLKISVDFPAAGLEFPVTSGWTASLELIIDGFLVKGGCEYFEGKNWTAGAVGRWG